jgi:valyl-tRNA synthetase
MKQEPLATRYDPASFERKWYEEWETRGYFTPSPETDQPSFSIVIPPPNVTGRLHTGHALVNSLIDIVTRWKRMSGFNTLWLPGTDHAGIATQMVVERELAKEGISRADLGREKFLERMWEWKERHKGEISDQLRRLGSSCDWTRERFTLDEGLSRAVRKVFVQLYHDGLIYRDLAMVNWCPRCRTAISDIEVEYQEENGKLYLIDYPIEGEERVLTVATTRPETMLGDTGVAVHPEDERYRDLIGKRVLLPLTDRVIPIVGDDVLVDREFGTGVVKITPSHDRNDYEAGARNNLPQLQVIDEGGAMTAAAGANYAGLDRFEARKKVIADLEAQGRLREVKTHVHSVGHCGKCDAVVEPMVSRQWFVRIDELAKPAIDVVRDGTITITPQTWEATYFNWMENIHDWCISRQLWWGHRIPAWYCECGEVIVAEEQPESCPACRGSRFTQETDVLDTWFSSALWPFSTMGWPEESDDYKAFYPTDTMITGYDILFFWVARMIMMGLRFTGEVPFRKVFLHGLVRDEQGQKMSKSRGNVIDPLEMVDEYGADALRFTLAIFSSGRDIPLGKSRLQGYAAFATKLWNASRFALMHLDTELKDASPIIRDELGTVERWILSRVNATTREVNRALSTFRFDEAANALYQFVWHELCDWYLEMIKPVLSGRHGTDDDRRRLRRVLLEVLDRSLRLLHPIMPFITEEIWQKLGGVEPSIMIAPYPMAEEVLEDEEAERLLGNVQEIITAVRNLRAERGLAPSDRFRVYLRVADERESEFYRLNSYLLMELARLSEVVVNDRGAPPDAHRDVVGGVAVAIEVPEKVLTPEQQAKLQKDVEALEKELAGIEAKLGNAQFLERAPAPIVAGAKSRKDEILSRLETLRQNLIVKSA